MILVSCDPGLSGALALHDTELNTFVIVDMPTVTRAVGKSVARKVIDEEAVIAMLTRCYMIDGATHFVIEKVQGLPGQSAPAAFSFGYGYAVVLTAARMLGYAIEQVRPEIWKAKLRVPRDKNGARGRASELLPRHKHAWPLKKHDGRAEAALIAVWAKQVLA